jgi:large subunit ribosomal protein L24
MANKVHVKKDDIVFILSGKDKSTIQHPKTGKVVAVFPDDQKVLVEGINIVKKHKKPKNRYSQGGIVEEPAPISSSKVMLKCPKCDRPTKVGRIIMETATKRAYARSAWKCWISFRRKRVNNDQASGKV